MTRDERRMVRTRAGRPANGRRKVGAWRRTAIAGAVVAALAAADRSWPGASDVVPGPVPARVVAVIDGDTIAVRARIWLGQDVETRVRVAGVDAPELRGACPHERALAVAARDFLIAAVGDAVVTLTDIRYDKFGGRVLARVENAEGESLSTLLVSAGLGRAYSGGKRASWCAAARLGP